MDSIIPYTNIAFPRENAEYFLKYGTKIEYPADKIILQPGDNCGSLYFIEEGEVLLEAYSTEGKEKIIGILERNNLFEIISFFSNNECNNFYITKEPSVLYKLDKEKILEIIDSDKDFRDAILKYICDISVYLSRSIETMVFLSCKERLYAILSGSWDDDEVINNDWYKLKYNYTKNDLIRILGVSRVTLSKTINELCEEDLIRIVNRKIQVRKSNDNKENF
jgi:CRP-like cAMP-binding protein